MTADEMRELVQSLAKEDIKYRQNLTDYMGNRIEFSTLGEVVSYLVSEHHFWSERIENTDKSNSGKLNEIRNQVLPKIMVYLQQVKSLLANQNHSNLEGQLQNLYRNQLQSFNSYWISSESTCIDSWLKLYEIHNQTIADKFLELVRSPASNNSISNQNDIIAFFEYYKFKGYDTHGLFDFAQSTEESVETIRKKMEESSNQLFSSIHEKHEYIDKWHQDQINGFANQQESQNTQHTQQVSEQSSRFDDSMSDWKQRVADLEAEYKENLRFKGPAQYWQQAANTHIFWSMMWGIALLFIIVLGLLEVSDFFKYWLQAKALPIQLDTMQGAALLIAFASAYAFIISVLSKLTLSSVHLYRDAREREQLTHLYLSLANETEFNDESRQIILQSLFSRADSGLLGKDGGAPVMPIIDIFRNK